MTPQAEEDEIRLVVVAAPASGYLPAEGVDVVNLERIVVPPGVDVVIVPRSPAVGTTVPVDDPTPPSSRRPEMLHLERTTAELRAVRRLPSDK